MNTGERDQSLANGIRSQRIRTNESIEGNNDTNENNISVSNNTNGMMLNLEQN